MRLIYGTLRWLASIIDSVGQNNSTYSTASRQIGEETLMQLRRIQQFSFRPDRALARQVENTTTGVHEIT